jgi:hypothetical protein
MFPCLFTVMLVPDMRLLEKTFELGLGGGYVACLGLAVFKSEMTAIIGSLPVRDVFGDVLPTLIVRARIPIFAIFAYVHVRGAVGTQIGPLHLDTIKVHLVAAFKAKIVFLFYLGNKHILNLSARVLAHSHPLSRRYFIPAECAIHCQP